MNDPSNEPTGAPGPDAEPVVIARFTDANEAAVVAAALQAGGVEARAVSDDCGGQEPQLRLLRKTRLVVPAEDAEAARAWLAECDAQAVEDADDREEARERVSVLAVALVVGFALVLAVLALGNLGQ